MSRHWIALCYATWNRFDAWRARLDAAFDADPQVGEIRRINREFGSGVEDAGGIEPSVADLRAIHPRDSIGRHRPPTHSQHHR